MSSGDTGFIMLCSALVFSYDTGPCFLFMADWSAGKCCQHNDGLHRHYGAVHRYVGTVWIFLSFGGKPCRNHR